MVPRLEEQVRIVEPQGGFRSVKGHPVQMHITSFKDAHQFIDNFCHDFSLALSKTNLQDIFSKVYDADPAQYAAMYALSADDFVRQVNRLSLPRTLKGRIDEYFLKLSAKKKLSKVIDLLEFKKLDKVYEPLSKRMVWDLTPQKERNETGKDGFTEKRPTATDYKSLARNPYQRAFIDVVQQLGLDSQEREDSPQIEDSHVENPQRKEHLRPRIEDPRNMEHFRYYLAHAMGKHIKRKRIYSKHAHSKKNYVKYACEQIKEPDEDAKMSIIGAAIAAGVILLGIACGGGYFIAEQYGKKKEAVARETLATQVDLESIKAKQISYLTGFRNINTTIDDYWNNAYWPSKERRSAFYGCCVGNNLDQLDSIAFNTLDDVKNCIDAFGRYLERSYHKPSMQVTDMMLDNFSSLAAYLLPKAKEVFMQEAAIDSMYAAGIAQAEALQARTGYDVSALVADINNSRNLFERNKTMMHQRFTLRLSPIEFFCLVAAEIQYDQQYGGSYWNRSKNARSMHDAASRLGPLFLQRYLIYEEPEYVNTQKFVRQGGDYESAAMLIKNYHETMKNDRNRVRP